MVPRRQEYGLKKTAGMRSGSVVNFRAAVNSGSVRRSSAVLPSVLTFLVIVASGGLLLMIEKGMLNSMETPPPRGSGNRLDLRGQAGKHSRDRLDVDVDSQVQLGGGSDAVRVGVFLILGKRSNGVSKFPDYFQEFGHKRAINYVCHCSDSNYKQHVQTSNTFSSPASFFT